MHRICLLVAADRVRARTLVRILAVAVPLAWAGCAASETESAGGSVRETVMSLEIPRELAAGEAAFEQNCASCHGERALGTEQGPPLVDIIYEPNHHADIAFHLAASRGVRAHHWNFGDMPPLPHMSREEMDAIIGYVRFLQRAVGIQ